jgi:hypothetical protein
VFYPDNSVTCWFYNYFHNGIYRPNTIGYNLIIETGDTDMTTIYAIHAPVAEKLEMVKREMEDLGAPVIRVINCGDYYMALEGSHRLAAAHALGLEPELMIFEQDEIVDITQYDWFDATNWAETTCQAGEVAGELFSASQARDYSFR